MKNAFLSGNVLRNTDGKTEMVRVISLYPNPMGDKMEVEEFIVQTAYMTPEGGIVRKDDRQLADEIIEVLEENGYEVIEKPFKTLQTFTQLDQTILSGNFEVKEIETK